VTPGAPRAFGRLVVVNRGEPAMRLIHAVRELDEPPTVIALHTAEERHALLGEFASGLRRPPSCLNGRYSIPRRGRCCAR
jgi:hypothetical protein